LQGLKKDSKLITKDDIKNIPYTEATLLEIQRLGIISSVPLLRYCQKDTLIGGKLIKAGKFGIIFLNPSIFTL